MAPINILQFICPTGMYGAEHWILALNNNLDADSVKSDVAIPVEGARQEEVVQQFRAAGQTVHSLEAGSSRFGSGTVRHLCRIIRENGIDVVHSHGYKSDILGLLAARYTGIKAVSTPHGFGQPGDLKLKCYIYLGKTSLRFFDAVAPLSRQLQREILAAKVPAAKTHLIQNAVDLVEVDRYSERRCARVKGKRLKIGYIGQLIPRKRIDHLLEIFNRLWLDNHDIELEIIGDGESRATLEYLATTLPSNNNIRFLGFRNDRLEFLSRFDLFVMTSSDEGIPRCLMEAIAMGVPVAAYDIPGIDQLVQHGETGLLARFDDRERLRDYCQKLLYDSDLARRLTRQGRAFLDERYSGSRMATEYIELYRLVLGTDAKG